MMEQSDRRLEVDADGRQVAVLHEASSSRELSMRGTSVDASGRIIGNYVHVSSLLKSLEFAVFVLP